MVKAIAFETLHTLCCAGVPMHHTFEIQPVANHEDPFPSRTCDWPLDQTSVDTTPKQAPDGGGRGDMGMGTPQVYSDRPGLCWRQCPDNSLSILVFLNTALFDDHHPRKNIHFLRK